MGSVVTQQICPRMASDCRRNYLHFLARSPDFYFRGAQNHPTLYAAGEPTTLCGADMAGGADLRRQRKSGALLRTGADRLALAGLVGLLGRAVSRRRARGRGLTH